MTKWMIEFRRHGKKESGRCTPIKGFLSVQLANAAELNKEQAVRAVREEICKRRPSDGADCLIEVESIRRLESKSAG